ncbi:uncharacterized protein LOC100879168 [Megachile rotundata]|uniref:uncharacterized protein LOC100879168 n=1 Tax=Megachile rotundata TaxID=143995 RepID=UPI003FD479CB
MQFLLVVVLALSVARLIGSSSWRYESGACEKLVSYTASRYVPYQETYRVSKWGIFYQTKVRWNYKKEYYTAYGKKKVCCENYRMTDAGDCEPICDPDCVNGQCIEPDTCLCFVDYTRSETRDHVCEPICTNCVHGTCKEPNVCVCDDGYKMNENGTICEPICNVDCEKGHAFCSAPHVCTCHTGYTPISEYVLSEDEICKPICDVECTNGDCVEPNVCACHDGYEPNPRDKFSCEPRCENGCSFGTCTAPNVCICEPGYRLNNQSRENVCEPICSEPCTMGRCVAPETCSCVDGYGLLGRSKYACEPICEKACVNGTCTAPEVCTCHEGYRSTGDEATKHVCEPYCHTPCQPYGWCTAPDTCICFDGYRLKRDHLDSQQFRYFASTSACEPICEQTCVHGYCSEPGVCTCLPGYTETEYDTNVCQPVCEENCLNGYCSDPNVCTCDPGYRALNETSNHCVPVCEIPCGNGTCDAPNHCSCNTGYQLGSENFFLDYDYSLDTSVACKPVCEKPCVNGYCAAPNICRCNSGYLSTAVWNICQPNCELPCVNGYCARPNECECMPGYESSNNDSNVCEPICEHACINAYCSAPNECTCNEGYGLPAIRPVCDTTIEESCANATSSAFACEAICDLDCGNGSCTSPNTCTCLEGYENDANGSCIPSCTGCENGSCVAPESCECEQGYALTNIGNRSVCEPFCERCSNGKCVAPADCRCEPGFLKEIVVNTLENDADEECVAACATNCSGHGSCIVTDRTCDCYYGWHGTDCEEPLFCILPVDRGIDHSNASNIVHRANETIDYVLANSPLCNYSCFDEIGNESSCYRTYSDDNAGNDTITCLISTGFNCRTVPAEYTRTRNYIITMGTAGIMTVTTASVAAIYLLIRKRSKRRFSLRDYVSLGESPGKMLHIFMISNILSRLDNAKSRTGGVRYLNKTMRLIQSSVETFRSEQQRHRPSANIEKENATMRSIVGCIVFLNGILSTITIGSSEQSNCDTYISQLEQRYVPYTETYRSRKWGIFYTIKTRQNYKIVFTPTWRTVKRCCDGYEETVDHSCSPICSTNCTHGYCKAPDKCSCNDGYRVTHDNLYCEPICHGLCTESNHAHCESPNSCVCDSGYRSATDITFPDSLCEPICETACVNGKCIAPNVCSCEHGYENVDGTGCVPKCEQGCTFGSCTAPNTCTCDPGYRMNERNVCEPICSEPCQMGECVAPESCSCNDGYGLFNSSIYVCEPICEKACVNGTCTAPGLCLCNQGYRFNGPEEEKHVCEPFCVTPCEPYGTCVAPNTCACYDGYRPIEPIPTDNQIPDNATKKYASACEPICNRDCINGKCIEPDVCRCKPGYRPSTSNDSNVCEPVCDTSCGPNSTCTEPNVCTCDPGYRPTNNYVAYNCEEICETYCTPNSTCAARDFCTCNEGYPQRRAPTIVCQPICSSCDNGSCIEPNVCRCFEGYVLTNDSVCVPRCEHGCENGDCLGPNECRCHDGFYMSRDNGTCVKSCTSDCNGHGVCEDEQNACRCSYGWTGPNCDQPAICLEIFDSDDASLDRFTVYNETNDTLADARQHAPYCRRCNAAIRNRSLCFVVPADNGSSSIGCFVEIESPCHPVYESSSNSVSRIGGTVAGITMLIVIGATASVYFLIRRRAKKRVREVVAQSQVFRGSISNQPLLPDENSSVP